MRDPDGELAARAVKDRTVYVGADPKLDPGRLPYEACLGVHGELKPFHGDPVVQALVSSMIPMVGQFVETGTGLGTTVGWVAGSWPSLPCWTCEAHLPTAREAWKNLVRCRNVKLYEGLSVTMLGMFVESFPHFMDVPTLFYLDAHSHGFGCPTYEEFDAVTKWWRGGCILIDDFQVPNRPEFGYDVYDGTALSWEAVKARCEVRRVKELWYPAYTPQPVPYNRGWVLVRFGDFEWQPPLDLQGGLQRGGTT